MKHSAKAVTYTGLVGAVALAGASQAYGAIVAIPLPANIVGNNPANTSTTPTRRTIDIDGNGTADLQLAYRSFTTGAYVIQQSFVYAYTTGNVVGTSFSATAFYAYQLYAGTSIGPASSLGNAGSYLSHIATHVNSSDYGFWYLGTKNYVGFSFVNATTGKTDYGYIQVETDPYVSAANPGGLKFFSAAYDNTGAAIIAGALPAAVPEPGTLAGLAFGGLGLGAAAYRRRKQATVNA